MKAAASTAENFRQKHGDQVAKAGKFAGGLYGKYGGQQDRGDAGVGTAGHESGRSGSVGGIAAAAVAKKKPPPPPPPKKKNNIGGVGSEGSVGGGGEEGVPPPVPMATRPQF